MPAFSLKPPASPKGPVAVSRLPKAPSFSRSFSKVLPPKKWFLMRTFPASSLPFKDWESASLIVMTTASAGRVRCQSKKALQVSFLKVSAPNGPATGLALDPRSGSRRDRMALPSTRAVSSMYEYRE